MTTTRRVAVAMSGGVDSSVAAAILASRGYAVVGVTLWLWRQDDDDKEPSYVRDARRVCCHLGIPHLVLDARQRFRNDVVLPFARAYTWGRTPNPCVLCNSRIKFGWLMDRLPEVGCQVLATGHYVRRRDATTHWELWRGVDSRKDQSYFVYRLGQRELAHCDFPLGGLLKTEVERRAHEWQLPCASHESQDICFLTRGDYRDLVASMAPGAVRPGPILDASGERLGEHRGLPFYTVGQRGGLGVSAAEPLYVLALDVDRNALLVGPRAEAIQTELLVDHVSYVSGTAPDEGSELLCQARYGAAPVPCGLWATGLERVLVRTSTPLFGVAPGQSAVFYDGCRVVGGGIIVRGLGAN